MPPSSNTPPSPIPEPRQEITGRIRIPAQFIERVRSSAQNIQQLQEILQETEAQGVTEFLHALLVATLTLDASDVHIEPEKSGAQIRFRIDGMLHDIVNLPPETYETLLSRIKLVSKIKLNLPDQPQDGRFSFVLAQGDVIEARVSTLPAEYGESIVLRVLNPKNLIRIEELGLREDLLSILQQELKKPNGMIIATGPTGSGKTTTLYAFLKEIERPEIKIVTIEDPIEYHLDSISQTQVNPKGGYDFASGLQAIVRQDPDVILVGEIRDETTSQIALQAALTGHLVFSTLHTNNAPGAVTRLLSLKAKRVNIGAATNVIIGQRLARKVCSDCVVLRKVTPDELAVLKEGLVGMKKGLAKAIPTLQVAQTQGCTICNTTGYKGRLGIFEILLVDAAMEEYILTKPSTSALQKFAIERGMTTMYQDGLFKIMEGLTTFEELARVTGKGTK
jgi:general secretion pathway protein E